MNEDKTGAVLDTIGELWSCHGNFTGQEISEKDMEIITEAAVRAASASAQQSYSIIILDDRETMKALTGYKGSRAMVFCADGNRLNQAALSLGFETAEFSDMNAFVTWSIDALLAAQNACLAARALGIDSLFTNGINRTGLDRAWEILNLPDTGCHPLITLILGYASEKPLMRKGRLSGAGIVHKGRYQPLTSEETDKMIEQYDNEENNLTLNRAFETRGYNHYLEWLFRDWLGGFPQNMNDAVAERLKKSGFLPS